MSLLKESQHLKVPLKEIEIATKNFELCIGKGGYGMVYKGELSINGKLTTVAVKRLNEQCGQGLKEFLMEIQLLTGQNHPNLITLLGYCDEGKEKIIVYEYAEHGSLDQFLTRKNTVNALTWLDRLKICLDAARGLNHLHNHVGKHQTIIHRDIKSANILIDHNWVAKISDLGLSKLSLAGLNRSAVITHACGTQGYCEPEYFSSGIVKKESDVYSFGMVLFEVLCGRLCFIMGDDGLMLSGPLAKDYYKKKKLDEIVDPTLRERMSLDLKNRFSKIAYECLLDDREQRPPMNCVVKELEEILKMQLSFSTLETSLKISNKPESVAIGPSSTSLMETQHISTELNSYGSDGELQSSDKSLQARVNNVINTLDVGVDDKAMLFDLGNEETQLLSMMNPEGVNSVLNQEVLNVILEQARVNNMINTLDVGVDDKAMLFGLGNKETQLLSMMNPEGVNSVLNQEVLNVILDDKRRNWENQNLFNLLDDYLENYSQTLDFCVLLKKCLKKVHDTLLLIILALQQFNNEDAVEDNRSFENTLGSLKKFMAADDPFSQDFFNNFQFVYSRQIELLEKIQRSKVEMHKKLAQWKMKLFSYLSKNYKNNIEGQKRVFNAMQIGYYIIVKDLDNIRTLVDRVQVKIGSLSQNAQLAIKMDGTMKYIMEAIKRNLESLLKDEEELGTRANNYSVMINKSRHAVLQSIITSPSAH